MSTPSQRTFVRRHRHALFPRLVGAVLALPLSVALSSPWAAPAAAQSAASQRPMTFLDMLTLRTTGGYAPSADGQWLLHTISTPDWEADRSQSDLYLVSMREGVSSSRQLTFTEAFNESSPAWAPDGRLFAFLSNRDAGDDESGDQLYVMRPNGGEAQKVTAIDGGVSNFAFTRNGEWLVFRGGDSDARQLYRIAMRAVSSPGAVTPTAEPITTRPGGVEAWDIASDSRRIYFIAPDAAQPDEKERLARKFTVEVKNATTPRSSLWMVDLDGVRESQLTRDSSYSVENMTLSPDGKWLAFAGGSTDRYERNITEERINSDLYLLETATTYVERLTDNQEVSESGVSFSPDSRTMAFSASDDMSRYNMQNRRVYLRTVADRGGEWRKLGTTFDGDVSPSFWSEDGGTIYFNTGVKATRRLLALDVSRNTVEEVVSLPASVSVSRDELSGALLINYSDPETPPTLYTVGAFKDVGNKSRWVPLTDANPQVRSFALGEEREITWTSTDGKQVGGVLNLPVGYQPGTTYPLIVAIHGGPASADVLRFNGGYGSQVYAGAGYAVLKPNYRGSTNYGEAHKTAIVGNYFPQGFDDIMTGVDHLIAEGIADSTQLGMLGWSAGGHWSNWTLTHTDRFKGISSGAGTSNWISMYAQSDVQRNRQFYLGDKLPYDDFDAYWDQSPMKYIRNAKTPTMIHVVEGDPRVPSPQSVELHMGLKKVGVPTELFMYPGSSHGIPDRRNRLVKSVSEMAWMDYYVRGKGNLFSWRDVLNTLPPSEKTKAPNIVP